MNLRIYFIFLESRIIDLHVDADNLCLSSFNFFWWALQYFFYFKRGTFPPFEVIQGRCDFLLVHNSNFGLNLHRFADLTAFMCSWPHPIPP